MIRTFKYVGYFHVSWRGSTFYFTSSTSSILSVLGFKRGDTIEVSTRSVRGWYTMRRVRYEKRGAWLYRARGYYTPFCRSGLKRLFGHAPKTIYIKPKVVR